jgi:hypothetical protein
LIPTFGLLSDHLETISNIKDFDAESQYGTMEELELGKKQAALEKLWTLIKFTTARKDNSPEEEQIRPYDALWKVAERSERSLLDDVKLLYGYPWKLNITQTQGLPWVTVLMVLAKGANLDLDWVQRLYSEDYPVLSRRWDTTDEDKDAIQAAAKKVTDELPKRLP